jgi:hypothetical protein
MARALWKRRSSAIPAQMRTSIWNGSTYSSAQAGGKRTDFFSSTRPKVKRLFASLSLSRTALRWLRICKRKVQKQTRTQKTTSLSSRRPRVDGWRSFQAGRWGTLREWGERLDSLQPENGNAVIKASFSLGILFRSSRDRVGFYTFRGCKMGHKRVSNKCMCVRPNLFRTALYSASAICIFALFLWDWIWNDVNCEADVEWRS